MPHAKFRADPLNTVAVHKEQRKEQTHRDTFSIIHKRYGWYQNIEAQIICQLLFQTIVNTSHAQNEQQEFIDHISNPTSQFCLHCQLEDKEMLQ